MAENYVNLRIKRIDVSFITVALEERLKTWENTLTYERTGEALGQIEESGSAYEAEQMVSLWKEFIEDVERQLGDEQK